MKEQEDETLVVPWSQLEGRRVGTSPARDGSEDPLRAGKYSSGAQCGAKCQKDTKSDRPVPGGAKSSSIVLIIVVIYLHFECILC